MPSLRDEITNTLRRLRRPTTRPVELDDTVVATDPREGRFYGNYRILRRLGIGGMGHVYLALDTHLGRQAALKFLSPKLKSNPEMLVRLQQEARTASSLNHPNILTIYDIDEANGEPFIASEFIEGVTLRQALERGAVDPASALDIAIQIASALRPAHEAGIVHRDLKPGNIMLRPDGFVKVIDFGLAKFTAQGHMAPMYEPLSDPGSVAGTVQYMSPEQARADPVDHRTDLWSLGVMLYEMVSRTKPFNGETESHVIVAILDHSPAELQTAAGVPSGLSHVVEKALAKSPDKRYQTAAEMLSDLRALDTSSRPSCVFSAPSMNARRPRRIWAVGLIGASAALAFWWWPFHGREALLGPDWFDPVTSVQVTHRGDVDQAALSPDGKKVAFTTINNGQTQLHMLNLETQQQTDWAPYTAETLGITFSPDSSGVYYTVHDEREWGRLYLARENSKYPAFVLDDIDGPVNFSPDGSEFAFRRRFEDKRTNRESVVVAKKADTGDQQTLFSKYNTSVGFRIAWSPEGTLAVNLTKPDLEGTSRPAMLLFSRQGKELAQLSDPRLRKISGPAWMVPGSIIIFTGVSRASDDSQAQLMEWAIRSGELRFFPSRSLTRNSLTASVNFRKMEAVTLTRKSTLWIAAANSLDAPEKWSAGESFDSLTWNSDDSLVHPSATGISNNLWEARRGVSPLALPQPNDCASSQPAAFSPSRLLIFASNCDAAANASNLWLLNQASGRLSKVTEHSFSDQKPVIAPDGDTVLYNSWPNNFPTLLKISLQTKVKSPFTSLQARNAAISPDGEHVVCQVRENYDGKWRAAELSMRAGVIEKDNLPLPTQLNSVVRWSPDGNALDYVNPADSNNIWRLRLGASSPLPLTHLHGNPIDDFAWSPNGTRLAWVSSDVQRDVIIFNRPE